MKEGRRFHGIPIVVLKQLSDDRISVKFGTLRSFVNDDGTRSFLALAENGTDNQVLHI